MRCWSASCSPTSSISARRRRPDGSPRRITADDVKANKPSRGEQILSGAIPSGDTFYGEILRGGRYFLFGSLKDMTDFAAFGEVPYSYTDIGAGPKGETIVMVMNKDSYPKGKPMERMDRFKTIRAGAK